MAEKRHLLGVLTCVSLAVDGDEWLSVSTVAIFTFFWRRALWTLCPFSTGLSVVLLLGRKCLYAQLLGRTWLQRAGITPVLSSFFSVQGPFSSH